MGTKPMLSLYPVTPGKTNRFPALENFSLTDGCAFSYRQLRCVMAYAFTADDEPSVMCFTAPLR